MDNYTFNIKDEKTNEEKVETWIEGKENNTGILLLTKSMQQALSNIQRTTKMLLSDEKTIKESLKINVQIGKDTTSLDYNDELSKSLTKIYEGAIQQSRKASIMRLENALTEIKRIIESAEE